MKAVVTNDQGSIAEYIISAFRVMTKNWWIFLIISCVTWILGLAAIVVFMQWPTYMPLLIIPLLIGWIGHVLLPIFLTFMSKAWALDEPWGLRIGLEKSLQRPVLFRYIVTIVVFGLAMLLVVVGLFSVPLAISTFTLSGNVANFFNFLMIIAGILLLPLLLIYLVTIWSLSISTCVMKQKMGTGALKYSYYLVSQRFWNTLATLIVATVFMWIVGWIAFETILSFTRSLAQIPMFAAAESTPNTYVLAGLIFFLNSTLGVITYSFHHILFNLVFLNYEYIDPSNTSRPRGPTVPIAPEPASVKA